MNPKKTGADPTGGGRVPREVLGAALDLWSHARDIHYLPISGHSMSPLIRHGDAIRVVHGGGQVSLGDIVVFVQGERGLIAHRVLRIVRDEGKTFLITKGDNVAYVDPPLPADQILGRVVGIRRDGREMSLDTLAWRWINRWITALAVANTQARLSRQRTGVANTGPARRARAGLRALPGIARLVLRAAQAALGRWERI